MSWPVNPINNQETTVNGILFRYDSTATVWKRVKQLAASTAGSSSFAESANLAAYATVANSVAGANVSGAVGFASVANSVAGANVSGNVANANLAGYVTQSAQSNITSLGTLTSLDVTGNLVVGGNLTINGTTTTINSTVVEIDDLAIVLANDASTSTQANGAGIIINGASANMVYINTSNSFTFSHKISADGGLLSNITGANVTGNVANANLAVYATTANSVAGANVSGNVANANLAGYVTQSAQSNITSVGNLTSINVTGLSTSRLSSEVISSKTGATGTVDHDVTTSSIFYHSSIAASFTANLINFPTTDNRSTVVVLILIQGSTPYIPNAVQIDGTAQTINWAAGAAPTGNANKKDIVAFTCLRQGAAWTVLGQLSTYG